MENQSIEELEKQNEKLMYQLVEKELLNLKTEMDLYRALFKLNEYKFMEIEREKASILQKYRTQT